MLRGNFDVLMKKETKKETVAINNDGQSRQGWLWM